MVDDLQVINLIPFNCKRQMRSTILLPLILALYGCDPGKRGSSKDNKRSCVTLFNFAGIAWQSSVQDPAKCSDVDQARLAQGKLLIQQGYYDEAEDCLRNVIVSSKQSADAYFLRGIARARQGHNSLAESDIRQAVAEKPDDAFFRLGHAWVLCRQKKFDKAEKEAKRAANLTVDDGPWKALHEVRRLRRFHEKEVEAKRRTVAAERVISSILFGLLGLAIFIGAVAACRRSRSKTKRSISGC